MTPMPSRRTLALATALMLTLGTAQACELVGNNPSPVTVRSVADARRALDQPTVINQGTPTEIREVVARLQRLTGVCVELYPSVGRSVPRGLDGRVPTTLPDAPVVAVDPASVRAMKSPPPPPGRGALGPFLVSAGIDRTPLFVPGFSSGTGSTLRTVLNALSTEVGARWWFDPRNGSVLMADLDDPVWGAVWEMEHRGPRAASDVAASRGVPRATR